MVYKKRILKLGDTIYSKSLQNFDNSYLTAFPQREQQLFGQIKDFEFTYFNHDSITDFEKLINEKNKLNIFLSKNDPFDFIVIDNPFSILTIDLNIKIPIIFDCIDWYDEMYLKEFGVDKRYYLLRYAYCETLERVDKVIAQSPVILNYLKKWGLRTKDATVIPNGFNDSLFYPFNEETIKELKQKISQKFNVELENKTIVVYTGKLGKWYEDIKIICDAIDNNSVLLIVGDGPIINEIPEGNNIIKCGAQPLEEVPNYTNIADILVFPVNIDCSPIAISEYLAVGKPIVMGRGRIEWLLKDRENAILVDNNVLAWSKGLKEASKLAITCRENNLEKAKKLSWKKLSKQFEIFLK